MIRFIVPLQSPEVSENWPRVSELCNQTLMSVLNQTNRNFEVTLVCNEPPLNFQPHPHMKIIKTDLPPPLEPGLPRMQDKWNKVRLALQSYCNAADAYYMIVDADDRVSNRLVDFVIRENYRPGWVIDKGLIYDWGYPWLYKKKKFDLICGTSAVIFCRSSDLPRDPTEKTECFLLNHGHSTIRKYFDQSNDPLRPLPFVGAIYLLNTGQNDSGLFYLGVKSFREKLRRVASLTPLTGKIKREFFLWDM